MRGKLTLLVCGSMLLGACSGATPTASKTLAAPAVTIFTPTAAATTPPTATSIPTLAPTPEPIPTALPASRFTLVYSVYPEGDGIYVLRDPSPPVRILEGENFSNPQLSSDGQLVMYIRPSTSSEIWVVNVDGSNPRQLVNFADLPPPDNCYYVTTGRQWQGNSHAIYYSLICGRPGDAAYPNDLWKVDADTGEITKLLEPERQRFSFSPDGRFIVAVRETGLDLLNSDGAVVKKDALTYDYVPARGPNAVGYLPPVAWSVDGSFFSVAVQVGDPNQSDATHTQFYQVNTVGEASPRGRLEDDLIRVQKAEFSPDGRYIAWVDYDQIDIFGRQVEGGLEYVARAFTPDAPNGLGWSADSQAYIYRTRDGYFQQGLTGQPTELVTFLDPRSSLELRWVDGDTFIFSGQVNGTWMLYLQTVGEATQMLVGDLAVTESIIPVDYDVYVAANGLYK